MDYRKDLVKLYHQLKQVANKVIKVEAKLSKVQNDTIETEKRIKTEAELKVMLFIFSIKYMKNVEKIFKKQNGNKRNDIRKGRRKKITK